MILVSRTIACILPLSFSPYPSPFRYFRSLNLWPTFVFNRFHRYFLHGRWKIAQKLYGKLIYKHSRFKSSYSSREERLIGLYIRIVFSWRDGKDLSRGKRDVNGIKIREKGGKGKKQNRNVECTERGMKAVSACTILFPAQWWIQFSIEIHSTRWVQYYLPELILYERNYEIV